MSDIARVADTGGLVCGTDLWNWQASDIAATTFLCTGCDASLTACSYLPTKKNRPHFRASNGHHHDCAIDGPDVHVAAGAAATTSHRDNIPTYPSELTVPVIRETTPADDADQPGSRPAHRRRGDDPQPPKRRSRGPAHSVRTIANAYIAYPALRADMDLTLPGGEPTKYLYAFKRLAYGRTERLPNVRIFYAQLRWSTPIRTVGDTLEITLHAGDTDDQRRLLRPYRLVVDRTGWDAGSRRTVERDADVARCESRADKPTSVFFLGIQNPEDISEFTVDHPRLLAFISAAIPPTPRNAHRRH